MINEKSAAALRCTADKHPLQWLRQSAKIQAIDKAFDIDQFESIDI